MSKKTLSIYRKYVNSEINSFFNNKMKKSENQFLKESYSHLKEFVLRPGKRLRPICTLMGYKALQPSLNKKIHYLSIIPELFHASSLIHDDIMDEDDIRRKKDAMHVLFEKYYTKKLEKARYDKNIFTSLGKRYGSSMAIMQGNILYSLAFDAVLESGFSSEIKSKLLQIANAAYRKTNEGQMLDVTMPYQKTVSLADYRLMVTGKTAYPISGAISLGTTVGKATLSQRRSLFYYGQHLGVAFQLQDDVLDISRGKGRSIGSDIVKGNKTVIVIHALKHCNLTDKKRLSRVLGNSKATKKQIQEVVSILRNVGSIDFARQKAEEHVERAKDYLSHCKIRNESKTFFRELADYVISRRE